MLNNPRLCFLFHKVQFEKYTHVPYSSKKKYYLTRKDDKRQNYCENDIYHIRTMIKVIRHLKTMNIISISSAIFSKREKCARNRWLYKKHHTGRIQISIDLYIVAIIKISLSQVWVKIGFKINWWLLYILNLNENFNTKMIRLIYLIFL